MERLIEKLRLEKYAVMQWHTQAGNITTNLKFKVDFTLPALSVTNVLTWTFHVNEFTKGRYNMILGQYIIIELAFNLEFAEHVVETDDKPFKGYITSMVDLGIYVFKDLYTGNITPEEIFNNFYVEE